MSSETESNLEEATLNGLKDLLAVGVGGFLGSVLRYVVGGWVHRFVPATLFPYGTLTVNVVGCFVIGLVGGLAVYRGSFDPQLRLFLVVGLLGGFTTFSAFGFEAFVLGRERELLKALATIGLHLALGLAAVWFGFRLATAAAS